MSLNRTSSSAAGQSPLVDAVIDGYMTWREESAAVAASYEQWRRAARDDRASAFDAYVAALDSEEHAASVYRHLLQQAAGRHASDA